MDAIFSQVDFAAISASVGTLLVAALAIPLSFAAYKLVKRVTQGN